MRTSKICDTVFRKIRVASMEKRRLTSTCKERTLQALSGDVKMRYSNSIPTADDPSVFSNPQDLMDIYYIFCLTGVSLGQGVVEVSLLTLAFCMSVCVLLWVGNKHFTVQCWCT